MKNLLVDLFIIFIIFFFFFSSCLNECYTAVIGLTCSKISGTTWNEEEELSYYSLWIIPVLDIIKISKNNYVLIQTEAKKRNRRQSIKNQVLPSLLFFLPRILLFVVSYRTKVRSSSAILPPESNHPFSEECGVIIRFRLDMRRPRTNSVWYRYLGTVLYVYKVFFNLKYFYI